MTNAAKDPSCKTCAGEKKVSIKVYQGSSLYAKTKILGRWEVAEIDCPTCGGTGKEKE